MDKVDKIFKALNFQRKVLFSKIKNPDGIKTKGCSFKNRCAADGDFNCKKKSHMVFGVIDVASNFHFAALAGGTLEIGNGVFFNRNCTVVARKNITIGDGCSFGPNACIYDHDHAFGRAAQNGEKFKASDVVIGNNCWIGANTVILRGTTIGDNCVIGAGCVVSGNIPANSLVTSDRELKIKALT